jgi:hypothetical protein
MPADPQSNFDSTPQFSDAVRRVFYGLGIAILGSVIQLLSFSVATTAIAMTLGGVGVIVAATGVVRRPMDSKILALAALSALAAAFAAKPEWASVRMMLSVLAAVGGAAAGLFLLSQTTRRIVVSALVIFHFCGILSAITSPPSTPWLTTQTWVRLFRPHLEFCYTNNAYQFYSPEPGPANVLWFCIEGDNGQYRWIKTPSVDEVYDPLGVEYYRRLSITERANSNEQLLGGPPAEALMRRREVLDAYPMHPDAMPALQFRMPDENGRQFLANYVRHVAKRHAEEMPGFGFKGVKVYLTQHRLLSQKQYADGENPYDISSYLPFFVGEFDAQGNLTNPFDPMLYWIVPILRTPKYDPATSKVIPNQYEYKNFVTIHAKSDPFGDR